MPRATSHVFFGILALWLLPSLTAAASPESDESGLRAGRAAEAPRIDGVADDAAWAAAGWHPIDQRWLGGEITPEDFSGRYKIVWTEERLYLLVEIVDDVLYDGHRDPLSRYWDDDCLEIFLDEDFSGGEHHSNHNAFAYHFSLDNRAIDIGRDGLAHDYTHHVESQWRQNTENIVWELSLLVFDDSYDDAATGLRSAAALSSGKVMGLMVAYCDNDGSELRENFIGSQPINSGDKDRGYIDAGVFGKLELTDS